MRRSLALLALIAGTISGIAFPEIARANVVNQISAPNVTSTSVSGGTISINWSAPTFLNGNTISNYQVDFATVGGAGAPGTWNVASSTISSGATSYTVTGLSASTNYYLRIAARNSSGTLGAYGYPWSKIYGTVTPFRTSSAITYENNFGIAAGNPGVSSNTSFSRVRYLMKATYSAQARYVDADFSKTITSPVSPTIATSLSSLADLRIPSVLGTSSQFVVQGDVADMTIISNDSAVQNGYGFAGRLEIWPWDYTTAAPSGISSGERTPGTYDDADTQIGSGSTYGSFQLHNLQASYKQTIFAWNNHSNTTAYDLGFGSYSGAHSDWTFCGSACGTTRTNFSLEIFANLAITTGNDTTPPIITGPASATGATSSISIAENTTAVHTFTANESVTWSKSGTDNSFFSITSGGVLTITARDFESPADNGTNNTYIVAVTATDSTSNATTQTLTVTITNVNEAPTILSNGSAATFSTSQAENISSIATFTGSDVDSGTTLTWSISGTDSTTVTIGSASGVLSFVSNPDFEGPTDSDRNNTYIFIVNLSDGLLTDTQTVTLTITNANETSSLGTPSLSATPLKGSQLTITVTSTVAGKVTFLVSGKRIANCSARSTTGSYPSFSATCSWKPTVMNRQSVIARITPTDNTFSATTSAPVTFLVGKRTGTR